MSEEKLVEEENCKQRSENEIKYDDLKLKWMFQDFQYEMRP